MPAPVNPQPGGAFDPSRDVTFGAGVQMSTPVIGQPTMAMTVQDIAAAGATGTTATALSAAYPALVTVTGASGAGVAFPTGAAVPGAFYVIKNMMTGALKVYAVGGTINGTTGTTAATITATGNLTAVGYCTVAGAWQLVFAT